METQSTATGLLNVPQPEEIRQWATEQGILILAHSYQEGFLQDSAHFVGDSLELARMAAQEQPRAICFCGVHFMAETAKILCPDATVFIPDMEAGCSLADSCKAKDLELYQSHLTQKLGRRPVTGWQWFAMCRRRCASTIHARQPAAGRCAMRCLSVSCRADSPAPPLCRPGRIPLRRTVSLPI